MPSDCKFFLDHQDGIYRSGETINGTIKLTTTKDKNVRHVRIVFQGVGKVKWDESSSNSNSDGSSSSSTTYYKSHEVYVNSETQVCGESTLPLGLHSYTFTIALPLQCPSSCEAKYGHIRYELTLILERPFRFNNAFNMPLTVIQTVDLNLNPTFRLPVVAEEVGSIRNWNLTSSKVMYSLKTPQRAYACGELVTYGLTIKNQSMVDIIGHSLEFIQKITFTAHEPSRREREKELVLVHQDSSDKCLRLMNRILEGRFHVPVVPPTNDAKSIIRFEYKLKVTVRLSGVHSSKELTLPIFIGNVPLTDSLASISKKSQT